MYFLYVFNGLIGLLLRDFFRYLILFVLIIFKFMEKFYLFCINLLMREFVVNIGENVFREYFYWDVFGGENFWNFYITELI